MPAVTPDHTDALDMAEAVIAAIHTAARHTGALRFTAPEPA